MSILLLVSTIGLEQSVSAQVAADLKGGESTDAIVAARRARMKELASSYSFKIPNAAETVKLIEKPLFYWATPERQAIGGELYLWTMQGRPFASIGMWTYDDVRDSHELQSFSEIPFDASTSATTPNVSSIAKSAPWQPRTAGVVYRKLDGASAPENTPVRRLSQAKAILRERFRANVQHDNGNLEELRLISQPLYRYQPVPPGVVDGLMFAFAMGTDPEVLVVLEARTEGDTVVWYYAIAPSTSVRAKCFIDEREVWISENLSTSSTFRMYINK
jgi:hypothetical protein